MVAPHSRRCFLARLGVAGAAWATARCGWYPEGSGEAYAPWQYPGGELDPGRRVAWAGLLAASPHNTQPWLWKIMSDRVELYADHRQGLGPMDPLGRELYIGLGAAVENASRAATVIGRPGPVELLPGADPDLVATLVLGNGPLQVDPLEAAIPDRHTHRGAYLDEAPLPGLATALEALNDQAEVSLRILTGPTERRVFMNATVAATRAIVADPEMNEASHRWWRGSHAEVEAHRDGLTADAAGLDGTLRALSKISTTDAASAGRYWIDATDGRQRTGSAVVLLSSRDRHARVEQLQVGRVFQRLHLWATTQGLSIQPLNQLPERQDREEELGLEPIATTALSALVQGPSRVQMAFRIGVAFDPASPSPRRPLEWVSR